MTGAYDWSSFYEALGEHGPHLLAGLDPDTRDIVAALAAQEDIFWWDGLEDLLAQGEDDLRGGVLNALEGWRERVLEVLSGTFGIDLDWSAVAVDADNPRVDRIVEAATP